MSRMDMVYFIEWPEGAEEKHAMDQLLAGLEANFGVTTLNMVGVATDRDELHGMLRVLTPYVCMNNGDAGEEIEEVEESPEEKEADIDAASGKPIAECELCGNEFVKKRKDSRFCSKKCYMKNYLAEKANKKGKS